MLLAGVLNFRLHYRRDAERFWSLGNVSKRKVMLEVWPHVMKESLHADTVNKKFFIGP